MRERFGGGTLIHCGCLKERAGRHEGARRNCEENSESSNEVVPKEIRERIQAVTKRSLDRSEVLIKVGSGGADGSSHLQLSSAIHGATCAFGSGALRLGAKK